MREIERFERCSTATVPPRTDVGLQQFVAIESKGERPESVEPYCQSLIDGKRWWEWTVNEHAARYMTDEWYGWPTLINDFSGDESGFRQIVQRIRKQHRTLDVNRMMRAFREWHDPCMAEKRNA